MGTTGYYWNLRAYPKRGPTLCGFRGDIETDRFSSSFGDDEFVPREGRTPLRIGSELAIEPQSLRLCRAGHQFDDTQYQRRQVALPRIQFELSRFDLRQVEDVVDPLQEQAAAAVTGVDESALARRQRGFRSNSFMPRMPLSGFRNSWLIAARNSFFA